MGKTRTVKFCLESSAIGKPLRGLWRVITLIALVLGAIPIGAQQAPDTFRWIDFHSAKDQDVVVWVTRALDGQRWTSIRDIGVEYDAALVFTSMRAGLQAAGNADTLSAWSVSLTTRAVTPLLSGVNLRLLDWMLFAEGKPRELGALYDNCRDCEATTFFTAFYYDLRSHGWAARWMRGGQAVPVWTSAAPPGVTQTQIYAAMADPNGHETFGTWNHLEYGNQKAAEDFVYRYDLDPSGGIERTQLLFGRDAAAMKLRLCRPDDTVADLARGQDSMLCQKGQKMRWERKPVTTPPAHNQGQSSPPGARH